MKAVGSALSELLFTTSHKLRMRGQSDEPAETVLKQVREGRVGSRLQDFIATQVGCVWRQTKVIRVKTGVRQVDEFSFLNAHRHISLLVTSLDMGQKVHFFVGSHESKPIGAEVAPPWESEGGDRTSSVALVQPGGAGRIFFSF